MKPGVRTSEFWGIVAAAGAAVAYAPEPYSWAVPGVLAGLWGILRTMVKAGWIRGTVGNKIRELEAQAGGGQ